MVINGIKKWINDSKRTRNCDERTRIIFPANVFYGKALCFYHIQEVGANYVPVNDVVNQHQTADK